MSSCGAGGRDRYRDQAWDDRGVLHHHQPSPHHQVQWEGGERQSGWIPRTPPPPTWTTGHGHTAWQSPRPVGRPTWWRWTTTLLWLPASSVHTSPYWGPEHHHSSSGLDHHPSPPPDTPGVPGEHSQQCREESGPLAAPGGSGKSWLDQAADDCWRNPVNLDLMFY